MTRKWSGKKRRQTSSTYLQVADELHELKYLAEARAEAGLLAGTGRCGGHLVAGCAQSGRLHISAARAGRDFIRFLRLQRLSC